jgi:hypothetical protein
MRSICTLLIAAFVSLTSFSGNESKLTITLPSDQFTVILNGRIYDIVGNTVTIDNIKAGEYRIRIYSYNPDGGNAFQSKSPLYAGFVEVKPEQELYLVINPGKPK